MFTPKAAHRMFLAATLAAALTSAPFALAQSAGDAKTQQSTDMMKSDGLKLQQKCEDCVTAT